MTRKKKRLLEEQARLEEEAKAAEEREEAREGAYYPGVSFGSLENCVLPVYNKKLNAVQLPPIIQPISFIPFPTQPDFGDAVKKDTFDDEFDDFDDWD